ncbi:MAG TPA: hypothetical protein VEQ59_15775 [Polyangiaceae bacterium]|nr:hypothetical protein [Polyangiaceae bacterium]
MVGTSLPVGATSTTAPVAGTPLVLAENPLRKQTLLGIAPKTPERSDVAALSAAPVAEALLPIAENPLRKQTLMGVAPPAPAVSSEAPTTLDVSPSSDANAPVAEPTSRDEPSRPASSTPIAAALDHTDEDEPKPRSRRALWMAGAVALAAAGITLVSGQRGDHAPPSLASKPALEAAPAAVEPLKVGAEARPKTDDPPPAAPAASASAEATAPAAQQGVVTAEAAAPEASAAAPTEVGAQGAPAAEAPSAPSAPATSASAAPGAAPGSTKSIRVESDPPGARLFWHGKSVGTTPFVLEYQDGEKHAYEMGLPGYVTRKVVIDSSDTLISIGLRPDPAAPPSATRRKQ